eukprot:524322-Hanusia_phi.AAC.1
MEECVAALAEQGFVEDRDRTVAILNRAPSFSVRSLRSILQRTAAVAEGIRSEAPLLGILCDHADSSVHLTTLVSSVQEAVRQLPASSDVLLLEMRGETCWLLQYCDSRPLLARAFKPLRSAAFVLTRKGMVKLRRTIRFSPQQLLLGWDGILSQMIRTGSLEAYVAIEMPFMVKDGGEEEDGVAMPEFCVEEEDLLDIMVLDQHLHLLTAGVMREAMEEDADVLGITNSEVLDVVGEDDDMAFALLDLSFLQDWDLSDGREINILTLSIHGVFVVVASSLNKSKVLLALDSDSLCYYSADWCTFNLSLVDRHGFLVSSQLKTTFMTPRTRHRHPPLLDNVHPLFVGKFQDDWPLSPFYEQRNSARLPLESEVGHIRNEVVERDLWLFFPGRYRTWFKEAKGRLRKMTAFLNEGGAFTYGNCSLFVFSGDDMPAADEDDDGLLSGDVYDWPIYVMNLPHRHDRRSNTPAHQINITDLLREKKVTQETVSDISRKFGEGAVRAYVANTLDQVNDGWSEQTCLMCGGDQLQVIERARNENSPFVIILEDDLLPLEEPGAPPPSPLPSSPLSSPLL